MAHEDNVHGTLCHGPFRHGGIVQFAMAQNGNVTHDRFDLFTGLDIDTLGLIYRGNLIVVFFVTAAVHMKRVKIAVLFQQAAHLQSLLQGPHFWILRHAVIHSDLDNNRKVWPHGGADSIQNLKEKGHAVLQVPAVFVGPLIPLAGQELIYQITAVGMDFTAVTAGGLGVLCGAGHCCDQPLDFLLREGRAQDPGKELGVDGTGSMGGIFGVLVTYPAQTMANLKEDFASLIVDELRCLGQGADLLKILQQIVGAGLKFRGGHGVSSDDETSAAVGHTLIVAACIVLEAAVGAAHPHGRQSHPVGYCDIADPYTLKQFHICHIFTTLFNRNLYIWMAQPPSTTMF